MFENEKIKNGLKSFFLNLKDYERFSYVQLPMFLVQNVKVFVNCLCLLFTCICFLSNCICSLYRTIIGTIAYIILTLGYVTGNIAYAFCTIALNPCMEGA